VCTLLVNFQEEEISAFMNRDESILRGGLSGEGSPKQIHPNIISPIDIKSGGTWIAVDSKKRKLACLLNRYDKINDNKTYKSRGKIPFISLENDISVFQNMDFSEYKPFTLISIDFMHIIRCDYDGKSLKNEVFKNRGWHFFTSSSWKEEKVKNYRKKLYEKWLKEKNFYQSFPAYNFYQKIDFEEYSPLVKRQKSETVSMTSIYLEKKSSFNIEKNIKYINNPQQQIIHDL
jgi:uncharacterized protein with NRDE domain